MNFLGFGIPKNDNSEISHVIMELIDEELIDFPEDFPEDFNETKVSFNETKVSFNETKVSFNSVIKQFKHRNYDEVIKEIKDNMYPDMNIFFDEYQNVIDQINEIMTPDIDLVQFKARQLFNKFLDDMIDKYNFNNIGSLLGLRYQPLERITIYDDLVKEVSSKYWKFRFNIILKELKDTYLTYDKFFKETKVSADETKVSADETKVSVDETKVSADETKVSADETKVSADEPLATTKNCDENHTFDLDFLNHGSLNYHDVLMEVSEEPHKEFYVIEVEPTYGTPGQQIVIGIYQSLNDLINDKTVIIDTVQNSTTVFNWFRISKHSNLNVSKFINVFNKVSDNIILYVNNPYDFCLYLDLLY